MSAQKKKILIIEDENDLVELVRIRLEANGYDTVGANDAEHALKIIENSPPDLIILDIMMPRISGIELCKTLKKDARFKHIPIIMSTAKALEEDKRIGREAGASAYLVKPFEPAVLLSTIKGLLPG